MAKTFTLSVAVFLFASTGNATRAENLLLNSSFKIATNRVSPDDWDLHHAAALEFQDLHDQYNLEDTQGPIAGARVLKITNSLSGFPFLYLLSPGTYVDPAGRRLRVLGVCESGPVREHRGFDPVHESYG